MNDIISITTKKTGDELSASEFNNVVSSINTTYQDITNNKYVTVSPSKNIFTINFLSTPFAEITLSSGYSVYNLVITNYSEGSCGKIIVNQTGFKTLVAEGIIGSIDLTIAEGTSSLITYYVRNGSIYAYTTTIVSDGNAYIPTKINDLYIVYSNLNMCTITWASPKSGVSGIPVTDYDIRYSNSLLDDVDSSWSSLTRVTNDITPATVGNTEKFTLVNLKSNQDYYVYIKSNKITNNVTYTSDASNYVYFQTSGTTDNTSYYLIPLSTSNIVDMTLLDGTDDDGNSVVGTALLIDEADKTVYLNNGYPDTTSNGSYSTYWSPNEYSRPHIFYNLIFDLKSIFKLDKMYITGGNKGRFRVYATEKIGGTWQLILDCSVYFKDWIIVDFQGGNYRLFKIAYDTIYSSGDGTYSWPDDSDYNGDICPIANILLYGNANGSNISKNKLLPQKRKAWQQKTVDLFFCVNGHLYLLGRLHSLVSGEKVRLYVHYGQFCALDISGNLITTSFNDLSDVKFKFNDIPWITGNNGTGEGLTAHLLNHWKKYGLKPYLTNTGVPDYFSYSNGDRARMVDDIWLPNTWRPMPKKQLDGFIPYYKITENPLHYGTIAKMCYGLAAKYGSITVSATNIPLYIKTTNSSDENTASGLDLISGIEPGNEMDLTWSEWIGYMNDSEHFALVCGIYDGNSSAILGSDNINNYGVKNADSNLLVIDPGTASIEPLHMFDYYLLTINLRPNKDVPLDVFNFHMYLTNGSVVAQSFDQYAVSSNPWFTYFTDYLDYRDRYFPDKEMWITEFGYGEASHVGQLTDGSSSKLQCMSLSGRTIGTWNIPDRYASDVKGAWTIRYCILAMKYGISMVNYYDCECEEDYFGTGVYDGGAGFGMFHWNDVTDTTPGAKYKNILQYEVLNSRGGFATTGIFGLLLTNGGYPITRSYWYIATFRNTLKDYYLIGTKAYSSDSNVVIACFRHKSDQKGAYAIYYKTEDNEGIHNAIIEVPTSVTSVTKVTTYVPEIPNPQNISLKLYYEACKAERTALPGAVHTTVSGIETVTLPTTEQNPYFPIVGPIQAININKIGSDAVLNAEAYVLEGTDDDGNPVYTVHTTPSLAWHLVEAVCDYIEYSTEGKHGTSGDYTTLSSVGGSFTTDITEFPEYYLFDAIPTTDFNSEVSELMAEVQSQDTIKLLWNNNNVEDTGYNIYVSNSPELNYTLQSTITVDAENTTTVSGLSANTTYYFKVQPLRNSDTGSLGNYISAKTYETVTAITNLVISNRSLTSLQLDWSQDYSSTDDFVSYSIYRATASGSFSNIATITDKTIQTYTDTDLTSGTYYSYKIKILAINGNSNYSNIVTQRTLLATETFPSLLSLKTNKIGTQILLIFDIAINIVDKNQLLSNFKLTEDNNNRVLSSCYVDSENLNTLVIKIPDNTLSTYDEQTHILLSYTNNNYLLSDYNVPVQSFTDKTVINYVGNYTNITGIYKINFTSVSDNSIPTDSTWNNIVGDPSSTKFWYTPNTTFVDEYYRTSNISVSPINDSTIYSSWTGGMSNYNLCTIGSIPKEVGGSRWQTSWKSTNFGRLKFTGLNTNYKYDIEAYGSYWWNVDPIPTANAKLLCNGTYSNDMNVANNASDTMLLETMSPDVSGDLIVDIIHDGSDTYSRSINYLILTEYANNEDVLKHEPFITSISVNNLDSDGYIEGITGTLHISYIGAYTYYLISESSTFSGATWQAVNVSSLNDLPFTITSYGVHTFYVKLKNDIGESNYKSTSFDAIALLPILINSVIINGGNASTDDTTISVAINVIHLNPTNYMISEYSDYRDATIKTFANPVSFVLSSSLGLKTVYVKVSSDGGITWTDSSTDTIELTQLTLNSISINNGDITTIYATVNVTISYSGNPTYYWLSELSDFSDVTQTAFTSSTISHTFSTSGTKNLYLKLKNNIITTNTVSGTIIYEFDTKNISFTVNLPSYVNTSNVALTYPTLKYDKQQAYTLSVDDSYTIYNRIISPLRGRHINIGTGNWALWVHTDGNGNDSVSYPNDSGNLLWWTYEYALLGTNSTGIPIMPHVSVGTWPATPTYMLNYATDWLDMVDFGSSISYHDVWDPINDPNGSNGYGNTLKQFDLIIENALNYIYTNFALLYPKVMIIPNGDDSGYDTFCKNNQRVSMIVSKTTDVYPASSSFTLDKNSVIINRDFPSSDVGKYALNQLLANAELSKINRKWVQTGLHRPDVNNIGLWIELYFKYLLGGDDTLWCPSLEEMYEWWYIKTNVTFSGVVSGQSITYTATIPEYANFYFPQTSLLLSNIYNSNSTIIDVLTLDGTANVGGNCYITRNNKTQTISYDAGDTAKSIISKLGLSTIFTDSTISCIDNKCMFINTNSGLITKPIFADNSGLQLIVTYVVNTGTNTAGTLTFHLDFIARDSEFTYNASANLTNILLCDAIKSSLTSTPAACWTLDTTTGTNTLIFTKMYKGIADNPTYTDTGSTGASIVTSITLTGVLQSGIRGYWNRSIKDLSITTNCQGLSYGVDYNTESLINSNLPLLINLDYGTLLETRAQKYVTRYETLQDLQSKKDAQYLVNQLIDGDIKTGFLSRINAYGSEPTLQSININNGVSTISSNNITVQFISTGTAPTYYRLSENSNFSGSNWQVYNSSNVEYALTETLGSHTLYAQLKNINGNSLIVNENIILDIATLVLSTMQINNGDSSTLNKNVSITYTYSGSSPTYYMISENLDFANAQWTPIESTIAFTLSSGSASKTVYLKLKNNYYVSSTLSSSILYNNVFALTSITINNGDVGTTSKTVTIVLSKTGDDDPTGYKIGEDSTLTNETSFNTWTSNTISYTFDTYGSKTLYCQITNGTTISDIKSSNITIYEPLTLNSIIIQNGAIKTNVSNVSINMSYTGSPTLYLLSEDSTFSTVSWLTLETSTVSYQFPVWGSHTLYLKVRDNYTTTDTVKSTILCTLSLMHNTILANISADTIDTEYGYINSLTHEWNTDRWFYDINGISENAYYNSPGANENAYEATPIVEWGTVMTQGGVLKNMYIGDNNPGDTIFTNSTGYYPNKYIWNSVNKYNNTLNVWPSMDATVSGAACTSYIMSSLPDGIYKIRILLNCPTFGGSSLNIRVNKETTQNISTNQHYLYENNNDNWIVFDNVSLNSTFVIMFNDSTTTVSDKWTSLVSMIEITQQNYVSPGTIITFADDNVRKVLSSITTLDTNGDGLITTAEAAAFKNSSGELGNKLNVSGSLITTFDEFQYFTGITDLMSNTFEYTPNLSSIKLPSSLYKIELNAFSTCLLTTLIIPKNVQYMYSLMYTPSITHCIFQDGDLDLLLPYGQFLKFTSATTLVLPARTTLLASDFLGYCDNIKLLYVKSTTPPSLLGDIGGSLTNIYVPSGCAAAYQAATYWSNKSSIISEYTSIPSEYDTVSTY